MTLRRGPAAPSRSAVPGMMRAAVLDAFGEAFAIRDLGVPRTVLDEVLIRVVAASINPIDVATAAGGGSAAGVGSWPAVLGSDFSGVVIASPFEAFRLQPGDEVYGITNAPRSSGSFAEFVAVPAHHVAPKPQVLSHPEAAAVPLAALTAWGAVVELAKAHEGQRILIHAGAGGVGHFAVQLASHFGAHVIATASGPNLPWLHELGATETIDYRATRFEEHLEPVDVVIDLIGDRYEHTGPRSLSMLRPHGLLITLPSASWPTLADDARRAGVRATTFRVVPDAPTLTVLARLITSGDLRVAVQDVYPFERIDAAFRAVEGMHVRGKVVVQVGGY